MTRPWQVLTAGYIEDSLLNLLLSVGMLLGTAALLQPTWGGREVLRFVVLTNAFQGCATWVGMIVLYILFREEHFLFARIGGLTGLVGGLSVALNQHARSSTLILPLVNDPATTAALSQLLPKVMLHAPSLALVWSVILLLWTHSGPPSELLFASNGIFVAWVYLRYYQPREAGADGDQSREFAFACLFPPLVQPPLRAAGEAIFVVVSTCGCFPPAGWAAQEAAGDAVAPVRPPSLADLLPEPLPMPAAVTTSDPEIAERRRERARALIEARLAQKTAAAVEPAASTPPTAPLETPATATPAPPVAQGLTTPGSPIPPSAC